MFNLRLELGSYIYILGCGFNKSGRSIALTLIYVTMTIAGDRNEIKSPQARHNSSRYEFMRVYLYMSGWPHGFLLFSVEVLYDRIIQIEIITVEYTKKRVWVPSSRSCVVSPSR